MYLCNSSLVANLLASSSRWWNSKSSKAFLSLSRMSCCIANLSAIFCCVISSMQLINCSSSRAQNCCAFWTRCFASACKFEWVALSSAISLSNSFIRICTLIFSPSSCVSFKDSDSYSADKSAFSNSSCQTSNVLIFNIFRAILQWNFYKVEFIGKIKQVDKIIAFKMQLSFIDSVQWLHNVRR